MAKLAAKECGLVFLTNHIATQTKSGFCDKGGMENERLISYPAPGVCPGPCLNERDSVSQSPT